MRYEKKNEEGPHSIYSEGKEKCMPSLVTHIDTEGKK
jgi:hypothetical protein